MKVTSLWIGDSLTELAVLSMKSYLDHGHAFNLYTYRDYPNVPVGVTVLPASDILPESDIFQDDTFHGYASFADWWRWKWLYEQGGFWTDLDVICISDKLPASPVQFYAQGDGYVAIGALRFPKGHDVPRVMAEMAKDPTSILPWDSEAERKAKTQLLQKQSDIAKRRQKTPWSYAGPAGLTSLLRYTNLYNTALPPNLIYPVHYTSLTMLFNGKLKIDQPVFASAWGVHMWGELIRRNPEVWNNRTKDSLAEYFMKKHFGD